MFTGIIEEVGRIKNIVKSGTSCRLTVSCEKVLQGTKIGDSICTSGVCLTVAELGAGSFSADVMHETMRRSGLGELRIGSLVNLERAMPADGRFGGHIVSGHIDGTGRISGIKDDGIAVWYRIEASPEIMKYIVEKGSIAIDGISLTVAEAGDAGFSVSVIPHTRSETALSEKRAGSGVNLECDIIGKYVERLLLSGSEAHTWTIYTGGQTEAGQRDSSAGSGAGEKIGGIDMEFLARCGF